MEYFYDCDNYEIVEMDIGGKKYLAPVHYRNLGEKNGYLYSKKVTWSDVVIHAVPFEKTFEFEDACPLYEENCEYFRGGRIIVNERQTKNHSFDINGDYSLHQKKKWMNRLEKMTLNPMTLPEAKKKRKSIERYPVKPKCKKEIRDEKINNISDKFEEFVGVIGA